MGQYFNPANHRRHHASRPVCTDTPNFGRHDTNMDRYRSPSLRIGTSTQHAGVGRMTPM
ncbi:hypothetical protein SCLCIDRAFT_156481 [Scleroderma citrinum Foug A]|uniref:Uncharacterized protein n=1 Tax=Scleroderma citrinum Foug A TaxID=1036808 RepID=A0A0C3B033_9AGAM|nr:hypothetical protein SCLCIDRAFT_156481 [Scleroderma citrinum Foug A]